MTGFLAPVIPNSMNRRRGAFRSRVLLMDGNGMESALRDLHGLTVCETPLDFLPEFSVGL
jgi:hypothetical protein